MSELREEDVPAFRNFVRMEPAMFRELLLVNAQPQAQEQPQAHLQSEMQEHSSLHRQHLFFGGILKVYLLWMEIFNVGGLQM